MRFRSVDQLSAEHIGRRVTVRRRIPEGGYTDVIGILEHCDEGSVTVRDRHGERFDISRADIAAARVIRGPSPRRR